MKTISAWQTITKEGKQDCKATQQKPKVKQALRIERPLEMRKDKIIQEHKHTPKPDRTSGEARIIKSRYEPNHQLKHFTLGGQ